ncbi:MAG: tRNA uridine-5-carboxymethylaminomethyl(34) synthesis GTPase MnmE [Clostridia bacterium]
MGRDEALARDTIAAIATPAGRGGIGVVRVSGVRAPAIARAVAGKVPTPRMATLCSFRDGAGERLDEGIALFFPAPGSYTGEDVLELQGHGGPVVLQAVLSACLDAGARLARPGEFTERAFLEGKVDLAQAEAVADLIDAASKEAARSAVRSLSGDFSRAVDAVAAQLVELRALTEAMLDFPEEEVDTLHRDDASSRLQAVRADLAVLQEQSRQGSLLGRGLHVVLAGRPNVGKSSLMNRLAGVERAIVADLPGTTRDALREPIELNGIPLVLVDTAGLRATTDTVERIGVERARAELSRADVVLAVSEAGGSPAPDEPLAAGAVRIDVYNKSDLSPRFRPPAGTVTVSAKTGEGLESLREAILRAAGWTSTGEPVFLARERHLRALKRAAEHLATAAARTNQWEFFAEELRLAHAALGEIGGAMTADDLLGEIFRRFCIGK